MPVLDKEDHRNLQRELQERVSVLLDAFSSRPIKNNREGCSRRRHWVNPEIKCSTRANAYELRIAIDDFKTILAELKRLK